MNPGLTQSLFARHALLPDGWRDDVRMQWDGAGNLTAVTAGATFLPGEAQAGLVLPGMVNLHSHAFQRALGGLTEKAGEGPDSFWTWRDLMYRFARNITPEHIEAIAAQLFSECLRHGYTSVCEFHYVQRDQQGAMYARPAETAERIVAAAALAGIGVTMLPVLYSYAGFGDQPLSIEQQRFKTGPRDVVDIIAALEPLRGPQVEVGVAPHSLRAAAGAQIAEVLASLPPARPVHIHIAEQQGEVAQSIVATGMRPVRYLMEQFELTQRWCLVHATHLDAGETAALAASGAVAGLCPTTEANLGDGLFPLAPFLAAGGRFGIGSDSHVSQSPVEELRWLEYGQRLLHQQRNVAASPGERRVGDFLWQGALAGGALAAGRPVGALAPGKRADLLVLDSDHPNLFDVAPADLLSALVFCGNDNLVRDVMVGGQWVVRDQSHVAQAAIAQRYMHTIAQLRTLRA
ncbi:formimidoylglutamate deiminase [Massilia sp. TSP1-1-2]|uniref:formimidoylglutamate deiminase n=1 Tax=Massilia sp. TSP1-1-2 TaxID=2804649 RepID=UPI003CF8F5F7